MASNILTSLSTAKLHSYYAAGFWRDDTIYSLVHGHAEATPEKFAMRDRLRRVTYREFVDAIADGRLKPAPVRFKPRVTT